MKRTSDFDLMLMRQGWSEYSVNKAASDAAAIQSVFVNAKSFGRNAYSRIGRVAGRTGREN